LDLQVLVVLQLFREQLVVVKLGLLQPEQVVQPELLQLVQVAQQVLVQQVLVQPVQLLVVAL
jgi:hypothetical protein